MSWTFGISLRIILYIHDSKVKEWNLKKTFVCWQVLFCQPPPPKKTQTVELNSRNITIFLLDAGLLAFKANNLTPHILRYFRV